MGSLVYTNQENNFKSRPDALACCNIKQGIKTLILCNNASRPRTMLDLPSWGHHLGPLPTLPTERLFCLGYHTKAIPTCLAAFASLMIVFEIGNKTHTMRTVQKKTPQTSAKHLRNVLEFASASLVPMYYAAPPVHPNYRLFALDSSTLKKPNYFSTLPPPPLASRYFSLNSPKQHLSIADADVH